MSWRDVQARVAAGGRAVKVPKNDPLKEGVSLLAKSYAEKMINDGIAARERKLQQEEELKSERQRLAEERRAADQKEQTAQRNVSSIIQSIGQDINNQFLRQAVYGQLQSREYDFKSTLDYFETLVKENRLKENTAAADLEGSPVAQAAVPETTRRQMEQAGLANIEALKTGGKRVGIVASLDKTESRGGELDAETPPDSKGRIHGGRLQFGDARLKDYNAVHGTNYVATDMKNLTDEEQTKIERWHFSDIDQFIKSRGLDAYIGQEINGTVLTEASLIAMAHLGGKGGMQQYLTSGGRYNPPDENKTRLSDYARDHRDAGPLVLPGDPAPQEGLDLTQSTFDILPPKATADEEKIPGSFEALVVANLYKSETYQNATDDERREMEKTALAGLTEARNASGKGSSGVPSSLNESAVRSLYAANQLKLMSADETVRQEGENWMKVIYPTLKDALLLQLSEAKPGDDVVATINGQNIYGKLDESRNFITADGQTIPPISEENPNGYDKVFNKDQFEAGLKSITAAGTDLDEAFEATNNTMDVVMQGYELDRLAHQYPEILTQIGGAGVSTFVSAKRELGAILDILGRGSNTSIPTGLGGSLYQGSLLEQVENYLKKSDGITAEQASVYKEFTSAMIRYIFSAGKALGQTGNGFSNQDYQNIRRSLLAGNGLQEFSNNMRTFSAQRMANSDRIATGLAGRTNVGVIANLGLQLGNETMTAAQRFEELRSLDDTIPDYIGWIEGNAQFEQSPQQQQTSEIPPKPTSLQGVPRVRTEEERNALPNNTWYVDPTGTLRIKE